MTGQNETQQRSSLATHTRAARLGLQFLTRIPVGKIPEPSPREIGLSLAYYPATGLLLGISLWLIALLFADWLGAALMAFILLGIWVLATGALHLDGFADSIDAFAGSYGNRERTLELMKDPNSGPMAVVALILLLLGKWIALYTLINTMHAALLILPILLGRSAIVLMLLTTPYVRAQGLGADLAQQRPSARTLTLGLILPLLIAVLIIAALTNEPLVLVKGIVVCIPVFYLLRRFLRKRLGGCTGDTLGLVVETIEFSCLLALVIPQ